MDFLFIVIFAGAFMLVPFLFIGAVIFFVIHAQKRRTKTWSSVAARLGLQYGSNRIWGYLEGQHVQCQLVMRGTHNNRQAWTVVTAMLHPRLDLGLAISKQGILHDAFGSLLGNTDHEIGDPHFDAAFIIKGDETSRMKALLRPDLRQRLMQGLQSGWNAALNDRATSVERRGSVTSEQTIEWALKNVAKTASIVAAVRDSVPIASSLQSHYESWTSYARANGMQGTTTPFAMWGDLDGSKVTVSAVRIGRGKYSAQVLVHYPAMLQHGLNVRASGTVDAVLNFFGGQDHKIGDRTFDDKFVVKSNRPDQLEQIFDAKVRAALLYIETKVGPVEVRDDGVAVTTHGFPQHPIVIPQLVDAVKDVAQNIHANAYQVYSVPQGPYR